MREIKKLSFDDFQSRLSEILTDVSINQYAVETSQCVVISRTDYEELLWQKRKSEEDNVQTD